MGKRKPLAKWVLPTTVSPSTSTCWMVPVPDDPYHKAAFLGALQGLGSAYKWQDDLDHTAKDVAEVWRRIADNLTECPPVIQFRNPDPCTLQASFDGGDTWSTIFSDADCQDANPPQPGATSGVAAGDCLDYQIDLVASIQWFVPFSLADGDTIEILSAVGIWNDSTSQLFCPDGTTYSAGACSGGPGFNALDPVTAAHHMTPVLVWDGGGVPMENTATIPNGTGAVDAWIQANDAALGDNFGQIRLKVRICKGNGWSHHFDFTGGDLHGWALRTDLVPESIGAGGISMGFYGPGTNDRIYINMPHTGLNHSLISRVGWQMTTGPSYTSENRWFGTDDTIAFTNQTASGEEAIPTANQYADQSAIWECSTIAQTGLGILLQSVTLIGPVGADPFAGL